MRRFAVINAPSILGLRPTGVEELPRALRAAGLLEQLGASDAGTIVTPPYSTERDPATGVLNAHAIAASARRLADAVVRTVEAGRFPVVLGGDCSIVIGCLLALRRRGRAGLAFIDGHADFYSPEASPTGEVADMDLAIVTGRGPALLTEIDRLRPLVRHEDVALLAHRDADEAAAHGSPDVRAAGILALDLVQVRSLGIIASASRAATTVAKAAVRGFWIHLDADVLDDAVMPAVDYRLPGGLRFSELG